MKALAFLSWFSLYILACCKPVTEVTSLIAPDFDDYGLWGLIRRSPLNSGQSHNKLEHGAGGPPPDEPPSAPDTDSAKLQGFYKMFTFVDSPDSPWEPNEKNMVAYALVEILELLYLIGGKLDTAKSSTESISFSRYFPSEDFDAVKTFISAFLLQFGGIQPEWSDTCAPAPNLLPLKLYYNKGPTGIEGDRDECENSRLSGGATLAYMDLNQYTGRPDHEEGVIIVCRIFFYGTQRRTPGFPIYRTLSQLNCDAIGSFATSFGDRMKYNGFGGMEFAGLTLLHEIMHWKAFTTFVPKKDPLHEILDDVDFTTSKGEEATAYGPYLSQELKRVKPYLSSINVESYLWWIMEEYWRQRCSRDFVDTPYENRND